MSGFLAVGAIVLVFGFVTVVLWASNSRTAGERGWVYNRHNPRPRHTGTLGLLESIYQPSIEHVIEERSSRRARGDQAESGDKPGDEEPSVSGHRSPAEDRSDGAVPLEPLEPRNPPSGSESKTAD